MTRLSKKLRELDDFLLSDAVGDGAMLLSQLDGFMAGIIVCPDLIPPSEWDEPVFEDEKQAQHVLNQIMEHYNDMIEQLNAANYQPIYDFDTDDSPFWEVWIEGFWQAMCLRPDAWSVYAQNEDEDLQQALFLIARLVELVTDRGAKPMEMDEALEELAPDLIPAQVEVLHSARLALHDPSMNLANDNAPKVGRNDPCPCGSGKKYKKCCLN